MPEDKATDAAEEVASFDSRIADPAGRLTLLQWMVGFNLALTVAVVIRLFTHSSPRPTSNRLDNG